MAALGGTPRLVARNPGARVQDRPDLHASASTDAQRLVHHPLAREALQEAIASRLAPGLASRLVGERLRERLGKRARVAGRDQPAGHAVQDGLRDAARGRRHHRQAERHRVEDARAEPLEPRRQAEHRERRQQAIEVVAEAGEHGPVGEAELARLDLERAPKLALARDHEPRLRVSGPQLGHGLEQRGVVLVPRERRDVADHRRRVGDAERAKRLSAPGRGRAVGHALVHQLEALARDPAPLHHRADRLAHDDDAVAGGVLGAREDAAQWKVHAAHRHERDPRCEAGRDQPRRNGVRVVEQQDTRGLLAQAAPQREDAGGPQVAAERHRPHAHARRAGAGRELAAAAADDLGTHAARRHAARGQQHLVLAAAPARRRVHVDHEPAHRRASPARASSRSFASLTKV